MEQVYSLRLHELLTSDYSRHQRHGEESSLAGLEEV